MVPGAGLEPALPCGKGILRAVRRPKNARKLLETRRLGHLRTSEQTEKARSDVSKSMSALGSVR